MINTRHFSVVILVEKLDYTLHITNGGYFVSCGVFKLKEVEQKCLLVRLQFSIRLQIKYSLEPTASNLALSSQK